MSLDNQTPTGWTRERIGEICITGRGRVISQIEINSNPGTFPVYSSQSRDNGVFGFLGSYDFNGDYVTWTTDGAYAGTVFHRSGRFNCTNVCGTLKAKTDKLCMSFLARALGRVAKRHVSYVGNPKLMNNIMSEIEVELPPHPEQRRIAEILDTADEAIQKTEALIAKLKQMKTGLLHDLLTRGIDENGDVRNEKTHEFKDSIYGLIPLSWDVVPAANLCEAIIDCKNRTPPASKEGYHVVKTTNVRNGRLIVETMTFTDVTAYEVWTARGKPVAGDILITREAPVGEVGLVTENMPPLCLGQRMTMYKVDRSRIKPQFLLYMLLSRRVQDGLSAKAGGSTVGHVRVGDIKHLPVPVCSLFEQERIADRITSLISRIDREHSVLHKYQKLKAGLMHDLLTGKKRVSKLAHPTTD